MKRANGGGTIAALARELGLLSAAYLNRGRFGADEDHAILAARHEVYLQARHRNRARSTRHTRNWTSVGAVTLNLEKVSMGSAMSRSTSITALVA